MTTLLVGEDKSLSFSPVPQEDAADVLTGWLHAWSTGMAAPLPIALKTSVKWLQSQDEDKARTCYEGAVKVNGEVTTSASLARQYPNYPRWSQMGSSSI